LWKYWYVDDQHTPEYEGYYVNGINHGHWIQHDKDGITIFDGKYANGDKII